MVAMETVQNQYLGGDTPRPALPRPRRRSTSGAVALVKQQHEKALKILADNPRQAGRVTAAFLYEGRPSVEQFMDILNK